MLNLINSAWRWLSLKLKPPKLYQSALLCLCLSVTALMLSACAASSAIHPAEGGLVATVTALQTGAYTNYLQAQRTELRQLQAEQAKQQVALAKLQARSTHLSQRTDHLKQATVEQRSQAQQSQQRLKDLKQQEIAIVAHTHRTQQASKQLQAQAHVQAQQQLEQEQRIASLLTERERLRQQLKSLISESE